MDRTFSTAVFAAAIAGLVSTLIVFAMYYGSLPALVPTHFGADGTANAWGPKSTLVLLPVLSVVFFGLFVAVAFGVLNSARPSPPLLPMLLRLIVAETIWLFFFIELGTLDAALDRGAGLGGGFFAALGLVLATAGVTIVYGITWAFQQRR